MFLPIEIAANWPKRVVKIRHIISQPMNGILNIGHVIDDRMHHSVQIVHDRNHAFHSFNHRAELVCQGPDLANTVFDELEVLQLTDILCADQERNRAMLYGSALGSGDGLNARNARY